ncbi:MAG: LytTR family DNA-binding domain-containing protein [Candidatus Limimorpha sp.]
MKEFRKKMLVGVPECMVERSNMVTQVAFSIMFALLFLFVYSPFSETSWFEIERTHGAILTAFFVVVASLLLVCSRVLMVFIASTRRHFPMVYYSLWLLSEIVLIGAFYATITLSFKMSADHTPQYIFLKSIFVTFFALGIPFVVTDLIFLVRDARKMLRLTNTSAVASDGDTVPKDVDIINIMDNNGHLKLSLRLDNLYFIKAEDNYIKVYYTNKGVLSNYMLRCRLQSIEDTLKENGPLMRCHRSYIVNIQKVKVLKNETDGFFIDLDREGIDSIPVSKTYADKVVRRISKQS